MPDSLVSDGGVVGLRYLVVALLLGGLWLSLETRRATGLALLAGALGLVTWTFTWWPLARPYNALPGSRSSFELALVASGAAGGSPLEGSVVGHANPRPLWSALWRAVSPGRPERALVASAWLGAILLTFAGLILYALLGHLECGRTWEWSAASFAAVLASSCPLDVFRPFGFLFESTFLLAPAKAVALLGTVSAASLLVRAEGSRRAVLAGLALGLVAWIDPLVFLWGLSSLAVLSLLSLVRAKADRPARHVFASVAGLAVAALRAATGGGLPGRIPVAEEVLAYRAAFGDFLSVTADMEWVFVLAVFAAVALWKRDGPADRLLIALWAGSYLAWLVTAGIYLVHPLADPSAVFHAVRLASALLAGSGGYRCASWLLERLQTLGYLEGHASWTRRWMVSSGSHPLAAALAIVFLIPTTFPLTWQPLKMDPLYYESLRPVDEDVATLADWARSHTAGDARFLASSETSDYLAVLAGRRVYMAERVVSREEARRRRQMVRRVLRAGDAFALQDALSALPVDWIVLDDAFRWDWGEAPEALWRSSSLLVLVEGGGNAYRIYRVTR